MQNNFTILQYVYVHVQCAPANFTVMQTSLLDKLHKSQSTQVRKNCLSRVVPFVGFDSSGLGRRARCVMVAPREWGPAIHLAGGTARSSTPAAVTAGHQPANVTARIPNSLPDGIYQGKSRALVESDTFPTRALLYFIFFIVLTVKSLYLYTAQIINVLHVFHRQISC